MSDWVNLIRRYRKLHGLTQAAFSELIGVEQATVSRWERGWHVPELEIQRRLRDLIWKKSTGSDALLFHRVRGSLSPTKLANKSGKNFAASGLAARLHGVELGTLCKIDYCPFHTELLETQWVNIRSAGFFCGEIASVKVYNTWRPLSGGRIRYSEGFWTPAWLSDGEVMLISDWNVIDESTFGEIDERKRLTLTTMDELLM